MVLILLIENNDYVYEFNNIFQTQKVRGSVRIAIFLPTVTQYEKFSGSFKRK